MNQIIKTIRKHSLIFLGFLVFIAFIWLRFLRKRVPRELPFHLSFYGLCILVFLCLLYFFIVKHLIKPPVIKEKRILEYFSEVFYMPLEDFDKFLKQYIPLESYILSLKNKLKYTIQDTKIFYWVFAIIPRIILVTVLCFDVFFFGKFKYIYYVIVLAIPLFLHRYVIYSLKIIKTTLLLEINMFISDVCTAYVEGVHPEDDPNDPEYELIDNMSLPLDIFIEFQIDNIVNKGFKQEYSFNFSKYYYKVFRQKNNIVSNIPLTKKQSDLVMKEGKTIYEVKIEQIIALGCLIKYYNKSNHDDDLFKRLKIVIFSLYFLCWNYVLVKSLPHTDWLDVVSKLWYLVFSEYDPFTGQEIFQEWLDYVVKNYKE